MKNIIKISVFVFAMVLSGIAMSQSQVYVNGYYKSNGTYVAPHYRTAPNNTVYDNWSTYPNYNPYTGKQGTKTYSNSYYNNSYYNNSYYNNSYYSQPSYNYNYYYSYSPEETRMCTARLSWIESILNNNTKHWDTMFY